ncbi:MAG TPA: SIMPL domain-containing protein [Terriglobales bacterium]|nr:SIMPL domain-containing protein [Terriglobales bacterium]
MNQRALQQAERNCAPRGWPFDVWLSSGSRGALLRYAAILLAGAAVMQAQETPQRSGLTSVRVHGQATISVEPDQVQVDIGIVTQSPTAKAAADQNAAQSSALVHELQAAFTSASIKGVNFSVNPNYQYPREGTPTIAGYTASNTVRLLLNDISRLHTVIDIAIKSGADSINRLNFTLGNENSARAHALGEAARQAQAGAEALAASLQLKLGRLLTVDEGQPVIVSPPREFSFEKLQSTNLAPISPGTIDVHADVDLTYEAAPAAERPSKKSR